MKSFFAGVVAVIVVALIAGVVFVYTGAYNVAADRPEWPFLRRIFVTVRNQAITRYSHQVEAPNLSNAALIEDGARDYASTCAVCHGAPGKNKTDISKGMNPSPPELDRGGPQSQYDNTELFWIIKNGIRMTGMPGFGPTHDDKDIWNMVAFIKHLPHLTPQQYSSMTKENHAS